MIPTVTRMRKMMCMMLTVAHGSHMIQIVLLARLHAIAGGGPWRRIAPSCRPMAGRRPRMTRAHDRHITLPQRRRTEVGLRYHRILLSVSSSMVSVDAPLHRTSSRLRYYILLRSLVNELHEGHVGAAYLRTYHTS